MGHGKQLRFKTTPVSLELEGKACPVPALLFSSKGNAKVEKSVAGEMGRTDENKSAPWHGGRRYEPSD